MCVHGHVCVCVFVCGCVCVCVSDEMSVSLCFCKFSGLLQDGGAVNLSCLSVMCI